MLRELFLKHPEAIGETYPEHAAHAIRIGLSLIGAGFACLVHAIVPGLCIRTASRTVESITALMQARARAKDASTRIEPVSG